MARNVFVAPGVLTAVLQLACTTCNDDLQSRIFDGDFPWHLLALAAPFAALAPVVGWMFRRG